MFLLFLLVFNSCNGLFSDNYLVREETTTRLKILSVTATPSLLFTIETMQPEASNRAWPLLSHYRKERICQRARDFLDDGWPITPEIAQDIFKDEQKWQAIADEFQHRLETDDNLKNSYPNGSTFDAQYYASLGYDYFAAALIEVKLKSGKKISWPFSQKPL